MRTKYTEEQIKTAVKENLSIAGVCRQLGLKAAGGNYKTFHAKIKEYNIDTTHFTGQVWNIGERYTPIKLAQPIEEILVKYSTFSTSKLNKRLLKEGVKEYRCECCNNVEWMGEPIPLELHHIDGINTNHRIENLQMLCPNCHAFTDNYRGKGKKDDISIIIENNIPIEKVRIIKEIKIKEVKEVKEIIPKYCPYCNKELIGKARKNKYCSTECSHKANGSKRPSSEELIIKFKELVSFVAVGKFYGVTDNAVRKWCKLYEILDIVKK